jgi:gliding motility-associated-like protein
VNGRPILRLVLLFLLFLSTDCFAQYILNGTAKKVSCNCYTLTEEVNFQSGSVWNSNKISLNNSFDFWFNVYLGCKDANGADGIVFILQPISTSIGSAGGGMGFEGVQPSIGIALDTWQNFDYNDPAYDHISIQANGVLNHNNDLAGPVPVSSTSDNVEDCKWHVLRIDWDAATHTLKAFFDGVPRVEKQIDLVSTIFNGDPNVFWGFTGATGGAVNLQQFCTALNPIFKTSLSGNNGCEGTAVHFTDASESFAPIVSYNWDFGDGASDNRKTPSHQYAGPGKYPVNLKIKGQDGCEKDSTITVTIGSIPTAAFQVFDTCAGFLPRVQFQNNNVAVSYQWSLDGTTISTDQQPQLPSLSNGAHQLEVTVTSDFSCGQPAKASSNFAVKPKPQIESQVSDGCIQQTLFFNGVQKDNQTTITQWQWNFGDGGSAASQNTLHQYTMPGEYATKLWAAANDGCLSDTAFATITISAATAFAGHDTAVIKDLPFQLHGVGNGEFLWTPSFGLSDPSSPNPTVTLDNDQEFILRVTTPEGCVAKDTVLIRAFKGPAIYVPSAFTPNGDGKNDILHPVYVGIKELKQFAVFNRWGQMLFTTNNMQKGWEGREAPAGTYVWMIRAVNTLDQSMILKGTVTIIR